jgi:hypothetical protein
MATNTDARQFDGKLKSAKDICAWVGDDTKAVYGPSFAIEDDHDAGLNLVSAGRDAEGNEHPVYTTVNATDWVVRGADDFAVFTNAQYQFAYGAK